MAVEQSVTAWAVFSAIGGAITGSILGGAINFVIQKAARKEAKKQRDDDRLDVRKARAYSLLFKLLRIDSDLHSLRKTLVACFDETKTKNFKGEPWQIVQPIANIPDAVKFSAEEMALVLSMEDTIFNQIATLDERHKSTIVLFEMYRDRRWATTEKFGATMTGNLGVTGLTQEQVMWLAPRAVELNSLATAMLERTEVDAKEARNGLKSVHNLFFRELGIQKRLEFIG